MNILKNNSRVVLVVFLMLIIVIVGIFLFSKGKLFFQIYNFQQVASLIHSKYVEQIDPEKLVTLGIQGMLSELDPYSEFLEEKKLKVFTEQTSGQFEGLGLEIIVKDGILTVISALEGTPAYRAGIQVGDNILAINQEKTAKLTSEEAAVRLRGPKGTKVLLTIKRAGQEMPLEYTIQRDIIEIHSVPFYGVIENNLGYVRLNRFSETSALEMEKALLDLKSRGVKKLILDLRSNPGGLLDQAIQVASFFLPGEKLVVQTKSNLKEQNRRYYSHKEALWGDSPLVVLLDRGSASGSEIVAGAIQDWDRGVLIGDTTWGKGLVQTVYQLKSKDALKLTTAKYYTPSGRCLQNEYQLASAPHTTAEQDSSSGFFYTAGGRKVGSQGGIVPDILVPRSPFTPFEAALLRNYFFFDFAVHYTVNHPEVKPDFEVNQSILREFKNFLNTQKFSYKTSSEIHLDSLGEMLKQEGYYSSTFFWLGQLEQKLNQVKQKDFENSLDFIKWNLKEAILVKKFGESFKYPLAWAKWHKEILKAKKILNSDEEYNRILREKGA